MKYCFNNVEVDLVQFEIRKDGVPIAVEPKVFDLIVYLIKYRSRLVSRDELFEQVWQGREVSDTSLSNHIKSARKLLGDNGDLQKVIKTIRSRGYHFIVDVTEIASSNSLADTKILPEIKNPSRACVDNKRQASSLVLLPSAVRSNKILMVVTALLIIMFVLVLSWGNSAPEQKGLSTDHLLVVPFSVSSSRVASWQPFADQITRELIQSLRKVSKLNVVPPPSSFTFKDNKVRSHIKLQLPKVGYVLDGVVSEGTKGSLRITVELENIQNNKIIWDGDFDIQVSKVNQFSVQSDIAHSVTQSLQVIMLDDEKRGLTQHSTANLAAYNLYIQGQHQLSLMTHDSVLKAIDYFSQAIEKDLTFEAAYLGKSNSYRALMTFFDKPKDLLPKVISSAIEVLAINPESAQIQSSLGLAYVHAWLWQDAWEMLSKARKLDANIAMTELGFALYYSALGDVAGVKKSLAKAERLDPLNTEIAEWGMWALMMVNEMEAATQWGQEKIQLHPNMPYPLLSLAVAEYINGNFETSIRLALKGVELSQREPFPLIILAQSYAASGQFNKVQSLINEAEMKKQYMCPYETAIVYALMDKPEKVFPLLTEAVAYQSNCLIFTRNDPRFKELRNDPRYIVILKSIGLDDGAIRHYPK